MEFRRIPGLPPYVFTIIDGLKQEARRAGRDVVDLGFGNPDLPSPPIAVEKLCEAAHNTRNHRYSASRGIPKLREAVSDLYLRRFDVRLDPDTEVLSTIGAKEGFSHLMWVLLQAGDVALVPSPSYPIHIWGPYFAGADARQVAVGTGEDYVSNVMAAWDFGWPKPRVVVLSFPHNPTTATIELPDMQRLVDWARERDVVLVHDFAYADVAFDGWMPPSILQCEGAKECAVELYSMTKSFSMAGWRVAFLVGNSEVVGALAKLKSYLDYGTFQPATIPRSSTRSTSRGATRSATDCSASAGTSSDRAARCSPGRRSPSPTVSLARSSSPS
jgi:alanine-synthesizing transaminase